MEEFRWCTGTQAYTQAAAIRLTVFCDEQGYAPDQELDNVDAQAETRHVVLLLDGKPAAAGRLYWREPGVAGLGRIAVLREYRGRGLGARLLREMERQAALLGAHTARLDAQLRASEFYRKQGYRFCGPRHLDGHVPHRMMEKHLSNI